MPRGPRLGLQYESERLREHLEALGISRAFTPAVAEFTGIAALAGTTGTPLDTVDVRADRPFLVVLAEEALGAPRGAALHRPRPRPAPKRGCPTPRPRRAALRAVAGAGRLADAPVARGHSSARIRDPQIGDERGRLEPLGGAGHVHLP